MSKPLTREELREELRDQLNDRFEHYEKRADERHREMMVGIADVITGVNDHLDERLDRLERILAVKERVDRIEVLLTEQFGRDALLRVGL
jgi:hypothetical protein